MREARPPYPTGMFKKDSHCNGVLIIYCRAGKPKAPMGLSPSRALLPPSFYISFLSVFPPSLQVFEGSPAAVAGLVQGDRIIAIGAVNTTTIVNQARSTNLFNRKVVQLLN